MATIQVTANTSFDMAKWVDFVEEAALQNGPEERRHICRVIYPQGDNRFLEMKTKSEAKKFLDVHGRWSSNCVKMQFVDIIRISRICLAVEPKAPQRERVIKALSLMAEKAEVKYSSGWMGTVRKVFTWVCNIFIDNHVSLFINSNNQPISIKLPYIHRSLDTSFVGTDANFARLVAACYTR